jgi:hypothetical protein
MSRRSTYRMRLHAEISANKAEALAYEVQLHQLEERALLIEGVALNGQVDELRAHMFAADVAASFPRSNDE